MPYLVQFLGGPRQCKLFFRRGFGNPCRWEWWGDPRHLLRRGLANPCLWVWGVFPPHLLRQGLGNPCLCGWGDSPPSVATVLLPICFFLIYVLCLWGWGGTPPSAPTGAGQPLSLQMEGSPPHSLRQEPRQPCPPPNPTMVMWGVRALVNANDNKKV